ncbi:sperm microtubule associated protein 2-like [Anser cygnoides]|uniref:sperm microtubule associated protein 2-like n=1 Tax=Anser cygnoides TaxID=8845 RepID=UPI0034D3538F
MLSNDVTKCLNSLLVFQVSCHLSTHSHDRQDTRTRRTQESALCKQSQQPTCTALGNSVLKKACVGKPRNNLDPLKGSCNSSAIPKNSGTSQTQARLRQAPWQVSKFALQAIASPRILELARAKRLNPDYVPPRDAQWPVTKAAKQAVATPRLVELAQPRKRPPMDLAQFNPDAFTVKESAKKATCSARIHDLARPIKR